MQRLAPEHLEVRTRMLLLPIAAQQLVSGRFRLTGKKRHHFVNAFSAVQRRNQRLNHAQRPVIRPRIAPGFQIVRFVDVPQAKLSRFVLVKTHVDPEWDLGVLKRIGKTQVGRCIVGRIAAQDQQHVHFPAPHIGNQIAQRFGLVDGIGIDRIGVN